MSDGLSKNIGEANDNKFRIITDLATALTIGSILLFELAWVYWSYYFNVLNIDNSFIDMPFEKYLTTTWYIALIVMVCFVGLIFRIFEDNREELELLPVVFMVSLSVASISAQILDDGKIVIWIFFLILLIVIILRYFYDKGKIPIVEIKKNNFLIFFTILVYSLSSFVFMKKGERNANELLKNYKTDVEITFNNGARAKGKFISFMNSKYFILIKNKKGKIETVVLNDSEIHHSKFVKE
nr:hypothetical protein [uncultured Flavobacterium sp.]